MIKVRLNVFYLEFKIVYKKSSKYYNKEQEEKPMKKLIFIISMTCLFLACDTKYYSVLIINDSSKTVSFTYDDSPDTITPLSSKTYEVKAYTQPPENIIDENGIASIEMSRNGDQFIFNEAEKMEMSILNTLKVDVKRIKADNYISYNKDNKASFLVTVPEGKTISDGLFIYTNKPNFSLEADDDGIIEPSFPVVFEWNIVEDKMFVTVR